MLGNRPVAAALLDFLSIITFGNTPPPAALVSLDFASELASVRGEYGCLAPPLLLAPPPKADEGRRRGEPGGRGLSTCGLVWCDADVLCCFGLEDLAWVWLGLVLDLQNCR